MKKYISLFILFVLVFGISGCGILKQESTNKINDNKGENDVMTNKKELVLYFSATGTTEKVAKVIEKVTGADIIEVIPKEKYTDADLNYNNDNSRANKEQNDPYARPEIENDINIEPYERIYLGYPIWWGTNPKIILSLLDQYNFGDKEVVLFCTSGSTGIETSINDIKKYNAKINILGGKRFDSSINEEEMKKWIKSFDRNSNIKNIFVKVKNDVLKVDLEDNTSSTALVEKLKDSDITIEMKDYANFEKVGDLGFSLPTNDKEITTTYGDVILYQGNKITIYYDTNSWNFTKLGHIHGITQNELKEMLGSGDITITLSLNK